MPREFVPFDEETIDAEFESLRRSSSSDAAKLEFCAQRLEEVKQKENPSPAQVKSFDEGFKELRHEKGSYKGRLLFYEPTVPFGTEELVILVVFRKQTEKTPRAIIGTAKSRMASDQMRRNDKRRNQ